MISLDKESEEEVFWVTCLRSLRILPPHRDEKPIKRRMRLLTWAALILDLTVPLVSIGTYQGIHYCCGKPIPNMAGNYGSDTAILASMYIYVVFILCETYPVLNKGLPMNLGNPMVGYLFSFAVFFHNLKLVNVIIMCCVESCSVICQVLKYCCVRLELRERKQQVEICEKKMLPIREQTKSGSDLILKKPGKDELLVPLGDLKSNSDDSSSRIGKSPKDSSQDGDLEGAPELMLQHQELRLLRNQRTRIQEERRLQRYYLGALVFNVFLACGSLVLVICISTSGGLCFVDNQPPNIFKFNQLSNRDKCNGLAGDGCQICSADETSQCYFPFP